MDMNKYVDNYKEARVILIKMILQYEQMKPTPSYIAKEKEEWEKLVKNKILKKRVSDKEKKRRKQLEKSLFGEDLFWKGNTLFNYFFYNYGGIDQVLIKGNLFLQVLDDLYREEAILGFRHVPCEHRHKYEFKKEFLNLCDVYLKEYKDKREAYLFGVMEGQKFPNADSDDFDFHYDYTYYVVSKENLEKEIAVTEKEFVSTLEKEVYRVGKHKFGTILVNNIKLRKPVYNEMNDQIFSYLFNHPNEVVTRTDLEKVIKIPCGTGGGAEFMPIKNLRNVVRDLGFLKELKVLFFPQTSKDSVCFINPITKDALDSPELQHLKNLDIKKIIKKVLTKRERSKVK